MHIKNYVVDNSTLSVKRLTMLQTTIFFSVASPAVTTTGHVLD